jgi:hypothetical protein
MYYEYEEQQMTLSNLTKEDKELLYFSLSCRKCIIETGDYSMSAQDAVRARRKDEIRVLTSTQMKVIIRIEELMTQLLNMKD